MTTTPRAMKLSKKQTQHLQALAGGERSSYPGLHMGVLNSLSLKGFVAARHQPGSMFAPNNNIIWHITDPGRAALSAERGRADSARGSEKP